MHSAPTRRLAVLAATATAFALTSLAFDEVAVRVLHGARRAPPPPRAPPTVRLAGLELFGEHANKALYVDAAARCPVPCTFVDAPPLPPLPASAAALGAALRDVDVLITYYFIKHLPLAGRANVSNARGARVRSALLVREAPPRFKWSALPPAGTYDYLLHYEPVPSATSVPWSMLHNARAVVAAARAALRRVPFAQRSPAVLYVSGRFDRKRNKMVEELQRAYEPGVHAYGRQLNNRPWPAGHEFDKGHVAQHYMFCVAIENCAYPAYVTEKYVDCVAHGAIPLWYGESGAVALPPNATIFWSGNAMRPGERTWPQSRQAVPLAAELHRVAHDEAAWRAYHAWLDDDDALGYGWGAQWTAMADESGPCRLCTHHAMAMAGFFDRNDWAHVNNRPSGVDEHGKIVAPRPPPPPPPPLSLTD